MNRWNSYVASGKAFVMAAAIGLGTASSASADEAAAQATTDSLINALIAAVLDITDRTTPATVGPESHAISLLLPASQRAYRLLDGTGDPINPLNVPNGRFESEALEAALVGQTTQRVRGRKLLTVTPLPNAAANCTLCHDNYAEFAPGAVVGAISIEVPIAK